MAIPATASTGSWAASPREGPGLRTGAPRRDGGLHGLRTREVHRRGRCVPGHVRTGRDPEVPPLPPHITLKQARALSSALLKGDSGWRGIIRQTYRDVVAAWKPHRG